MQLVFSNLYNSFFAKFNRPVSIGQSGQSPRLPNWQSLTVWALTATTIQCIFCKRQTSMCASVVSIVSQFLWKTLRSPSLVPRKHRGSMISAHLSHWTSISYLSIIMLVGYRVHMDISQDLLNGLMVYMIVYVYIWNDMKWLNMV